MLDPPLTEKATADRSWLTKKLGRRLGGPWIDEGLARWCVELTKQDGKCIWYYGVTLEEAYRAIRRDIEAHLDSRRRLRAVS